MKHPCKYIIPPSYFEREEQQAKPTPVVEENIPVITEIKETVVTTQVEKEVTQKPTQPKKGRRRPSSSLSLKSVHQKKEQITLKKEIDLTNMPRNPFTKADFEVHWVKYISILNRQGEKMLASILKSAVPILKKTTIQLTYPNAMMADELSRKKGPVLNYLRSKLQNYDIAFELITDEKQEKKYAYTPQEKYQKLVELNPMLEALRVELLLDI